MEKEKLNLQPRSPPLFADEVLVQSGIKYNSDKKALFKKTGLIRLAFLDMRTKSVISDVIISPITAEAMYGILGRHLVNLSKKMKSNKMPKQKVAGKPTSTQSYIG